MVNGPEDLPFEWDAVDWLSREDEVRRLRQRIFKATQGASTPFALAACLSRVPRRVARTVLRGDRRSNAAVLPDRHRSVIVRQTVAGEQLSVSRIGNDPIALAEEIGKAEAASPPP